MLSALSSWIQRSIVQPISRVISSWTTPRATTTSAPTVSTPARSTPVQLVPGAVAKATSWATQHPTSKAVQQWKATAPTAAVARPTAQQPSVLQSLLSWLTPRQPAQLVPGAAEKAESWAVQHPTSPAVQSWARGLPAGAAQDLLRFQLATSAVYPTAQSLAKSQQATGRALSTLGATPTESWDPVSKQYVPYNPALGQSYQEGLRKGQEAMGWLENQPKMELEKYFPADWQPSQDIFGKSEKGQSLLDTLQGWMGKAGKALQEPFTTPLTPGEVGAETPAPKAIQPFTPEELKTAKWELLPRTVPFEEVTPSLENKYWWQGGTQLGPPTQEQFNTVEYVQGYLSTLLGEKANPQYYTNGELNEKGAAKWSEVIGDIASDAIDGHYTVDQISKDPVIHEGVTFEMLMQGKYDKNWVETLQDTNLATVVRSVASKDVAKLPPEISQERLDAMKRGPDFAAVYDLGYRSQVYQSEMTTIVQQAQAQGVPVTYSPEVLDTLTYANIEGLKQELAQISPAQWQQIIDNNGQITLKTEFWKFNQRGEPVNQASWDIDFPPESEMKQSEKERYIDQQRFYNEWYWSDESVAQRQKEREEWDEFQREKDLEGWKEYYSILDTMRLYPDANEYWSQPGKFAELRRKWETSKSGLSWEAWLQQFDFEGEWYAKAPSERGEKKYIYSPRMMRLNY